MIEQDFKREMDRLMGVFGERSYPGEKLKRVYQITSEVSSKALREIVDTMIDNFKFAPTPNDFREAVSSWRRTNRTFTESTENENRPVECTKCNDLGIIRIQNNDNQKIESLMRCNCDCDCGGSQAFMVPQWDRTLGAVYIPSPCPVDWFKPVIKESDADDKIYRDIMQIVSDWKIRCKRAETHWAGLGYKGG